MSITMHQFKALLLALRFCIYAKLYIHVRQMHVGRQKKNKIDVDASD